MTSQLHAGRVTPASGSGTLTKNDVTNEAWSFEVKSTSQKGYRLTLDTLTAAEKNALESGRRMALVLHFNIEPGRKARRFVVLDENDFLEMTQG